MHHGKVFLLAAVMSTLVACSQNNQKDSAINDRMTSSGIFDDITNTVDYEKAAKLNIELGLGYLKQEQMSRAKSKFLRAKKLAPNLPEVYYAYGQFLEYVGEHAQAEKSYQKAISLNPKGGNEHNHYGTFLCRRHDYLNAEKEFLRAIEDPGFTNTAEALENAGLCILQIPNRVKAIEYFEKALRYDPNRATTLLELAILAFQEGKISEAKEYHARLTQVANPTERSALLGVELAKNGKNKGATHQMLLNSQLSVSQPLALFGSITNS